MGRIRVIRTASGTVTLGAYVKAWREVKAAPAGTEFRSSLCGWAPETRETILSQFQDGLAGRINRHIPGFGVGRKWASEWQHETRYAARQLNCPRLVIRWLPAWLKKRFAQRLADGLEN